MSQLVVGEKYLTPWEPRGIVKVVWLEEACWPYKPTAVVQFTHDHQGYPAGSIGRYQQHELSPLTESGAAT